MDAMLAGAMLTNSGGPTAQLILVVIAGTLLVVGNLWIRRITGFREDSKRSFFRYRRRR